MIEKMMDPKIIDYYIINCAIPSIITIENRYQIDFGKPGYGYVLWSRKLKIGRQWNYLTGVRLYAQNNNFETGSRYEIKIFSLMDFTEN